MATNSIILLLVLSISCLCSTRDVYIQPSEGEHCPAGTCYNITTFGKMANSFSNSFGLVVHFSEGTHLLDLQELVVFTSLTNAVFEGDGPMEQGFHETIWQSTVVIKCKHSSTGIAFANSSNITFKYITITNCGADMSANLNIYTKQSHLISDLNCLTASLGYFYVDRITIDHASVQNGSETGLLIVTNGVDLVISNSSFAQNGLDGNIAVVYTDPLDIAFHQYKPKLKALNITNTNLSFAGSSYTSSYCASLFMLMFQKSYSVDIVLEFVVAYKNRGYSTIYIASSVVDVPTYNLTIYNSHISHSDGAGLIVTKSFLNSDILYQHLCDYGQCDYNQAIVIVNSNFTYNHRSRAVIEIAFEGIKYTPVVRIESTEISHNTPRKHGLYFSSRSIYRIQSHFRVTLLNVVVNNNSNCQMHSSASFFDSDEFIISAFHAVFVTSLELNNVNITNNNMTGLSVYRTAVVVNGTSIFHNNTGIYFGGGLAMYGNSYLMFRNHSMLNFTKNSAKIGGAIFVETSYLLSESVCFFQYNSESKLPQLPAMASFSDKR